MNKVSLNARTLSWILIGIIIIGMLAGGTVSWYLHGILDEKIKAANSVEQAAKETAASLEGAQRLKNYLQKNELDTLKAASIVAQTTFYKYQNQIVEDVTKYAQKADVVILGFDFPQDNASLKPDATTGLKSLKASVTLRNPVVYTNYLKFLKLIEQNLTKMQITDISITPDPNNATLVNNPTVGIEVYVK